MKQAGFVVGLFCFSLLHSCGGDSATVAQVNDVKLSQHEAEILMEHLGYDINKSSDWSRFLDRWTKSEVLYQELQNNSEEQAILTDLLSNLYKGELAGTLLEEREISKELDSVVTDKQIESYYKSNSSSFALQDYLVKALYIKIPKGVEVEKKLREVYLLKNDKDLSKVNSYAKLYAENFYFDDENWIYFSELTKDIPMKQFNKDNIVLNRTKTFFSDDEFSYFLNILDYRLKDEIPPIEFLKPQIREIILSSRINSIREKNEKDHYHSIEKKHDVKIYYH